MPDIFVPFLGIDMDSPLEQHISNLLADVANDVAYFAYTDLTDFPFTPFHTIFRKHKISDGTLLLARDCVDILGVSGHKHLIYGRLSAQQFTFSLDKSHFYVMSSPFNNSVYKTSKIRGSDLTEVLVIEPTDVIDVLTYACPSMYVSFTLDNTEFLAHQYNDKLEIYNATTGASVLLSSAFGLFPDTRHMVAGEKVDTLTDSTQTFYMLNSQGSGSLQTRIIKLVYDKNAGTITQSSPGFKEAVDFNASWPPSGINHTWLVLDPSDNNLIVGISCLDDPAAGVPEFYVAKLSTVDASIVWKYPIGENQTEFKAGPLWDISGSLKVLSTPTTGYSPASPWGNSRAALVEINTSTGALAGYQLSTELDFDAFSSLSQPVGFYYSPSRIYLYYNANRTSDPNIWGWIDFESEGVSPSSSEPTGKRRGPRPLWETPLDRDGGPKKRNQLWQNPYGVNPPKQKIPAPPPSPPPEPKRDMAIPKTRQELEALASGMNLQAYADMEYDNPELAKMLWPLLAKRFAQTEMN